MATIGAAYQGIKNKNPDLSHEELMDRAKRISDRSHGIYGRVTLPSWARGASPGAQIMKAAYVFQKFSHNYLLNLSRLWFEMFTAKGERTAAAKSFLFMAFSPVILGGIGSSALAPLLKSIASIWDDDDPEEELYRIVEQFTNEKAATAVRYGVPGLIPGVSLKGSLAVSIFSIPTTWADLLGAPGAVFRDLYDGGKLLVRGDVSKGFEKILPNAAGGVLRARREYKEGVTRWDNSPVFYGMDPLKANFWEAALRVMSFNPSRIAAAREKQWHEYQVETRTRVRKIFALES